MLIILFWGFLSGVLCCFNIEKCCDVSHPQARCISSKIRKLCECIRVDNSVTVIYANRGLKEVITNHSVTIIFNVEDQYETFKCKELQTLKYGKRIRNCETNNYTRTDFTITKRQGWEADYKTSNSTTTEGQEREGLNIEFIWSISVNIFLGVSILILILVVIAIIKKYRSAAAASSLPDDTPTSFNMMTSPLRNTSSSPEFMLLSASPRKLHSSSPSMLQASPRMGVRAVVQSSPRRARCFGTFDLRQSPLVTKSRISKL